MPLPDEPTADTDPVDPVGPVDLLAPVDLASLYDPATVQAIDAAGRRPEPRRPSDDLPLARRAVAAGGLAAASALTGARVVFEDDDRTHRHVTEIRPDTTPRAPRRVTLYFVPNAPRLTRAVIRPWLPA